MRLLIAICGLLVASPAAAYTVASGFSDPCHELITGRLFVDLVRKIDTSQIPVPRHGTWRDLSSYMLDRMGLQDEPLTEVDRFILVSLIIGVREPDTDGHSIMNLDNLRKLHGDPSAAGQYAHALRGQYDDGPEGDASAVAGTRLVILDLVAEGQRYLERPASEQIVTAKVYLDFHGRVDVKVHAPLFYVGQAAHALQDSFSHMLRSDADDLKKIVHVMNYIDAITGHLEEGRDGMAHSDSMDQCLRGEAADLLEAATQATREFAAAVRDRYAGADPDAVDAVLDEWLTLQPGCTRADGFCGNERWVRLARKEQTSPYLRALFGCASAQGARPGAGLTLLALCWLVGRALQRGRVAH